MDFFGGFLSHQHRPPGSGSRGDPALPERPGRGGWGCHLGWGSLRGSGAVGTPPVCPGTLQSAAAARRGLITGRRRARPPTAPRPRRAPAITRYLYPAGRRDPARAGGTRSGGAPSPGGRPAPSVCPSLPPSLLPIPPSLLCLIPPIYPPGSGADTNSRGLSRSVPNVRGCQPHHGTSLGGLSPLR